MGSGDIEESSRITQSLYRISNDFIFKNFENHKTFSKIKFRIIYSFRSIIIISDINAGLSVP